MKTESREETSQNLRAVGAIAGNLRRGGICFDNREEESGVGAILLEVGEVQLEQAAGRQTRVAVVRAGPAAFELLDQTVVDNVTAGGDVQEQVDLLDIVDKSIGSALDRDLCGGSWLRRWKGGH